MGAGLHILASAWPCMRRLAINSFIVFHSLSQALEIHTEDTTRKDAQLQANVDLMHTILQA